uniref:ANK_REP_REGION domain-containing protein n=1 Tax=Parastrongyloides trichosuri TaxID=131310 RepID=A0A0N4ZG41_PARTI
MLKKKYTIGISDRILVVKNSWIEEKYSENILDVDTNASCVVDDVSNKINLMNIRKLDTVYEETRLPIKQVQFQDDFNHFESSGESTKTTKSDICCYCLNKAKNHDIKECIGRTTDDNGDLEITHNSRTLSLGTMGVSLMNINENQIHERKEKFIRSLIIEIADGNLSSVKKFIKECRIKVDDHCPQDIPILFYAIKYDRATILDYILSKNADLYQEAPRQRNILHFTVRYNRIKSMKIITRYITNILQKGKKNKGIISYIFSRRGKSNSINKLIALAKRKDADGNTPLHLACRHTNSDMLHRLLLLYFKIMEDSNDLIEVFQAKNNDNETMLHVAASSRNAEAIFILFEKMKDIYSSVGSNKKSEDIPKWLKDSFIQMISWNNLNGENILFKLCKSSCFCHRNVEEYDKNKSLTFMTKSSKQLEDTLNNDDKEHCENCFITMATFIKIILKYYPETFKTYDNYGRNLLSAAAVYGNLSLLKQLMELVHLDPHETDQHNRTPLHHASSRGYISVVKYLAEKCHVNICLKDDHGLTALHYATIKEHCDIIQILLLANRKCDAKNSYGHTSLMWAVINGCLKALEKLIFLDPYHCKKEFDFDGFNAVHLAIKYGQVKALKLLLDNGWSASTKTLNGLSVIQVAIRTNSINMLEILLNDFIPLDEVDEHGNSILHTAASNKKYLPILEYLLKRVDIQYSILNCVNNEGLTPINYAASNGCTGAFKLFLNYGADVHIQDNNGYNAFMKAAKNKIWSIFALTGNYRFNFNALNEIENKTLLDYVLENSNFPIAMGLRRQGGRTAEEIKGGMCN